MRASDRRTKAEKLALPKRLPAADPAPPPAASTAASDWHGRWDSVARIQRRWDQVALIQKGGFDLGTALFALDTDDLNTKEVVAVWLRGELKKHRDSKKAILPRVEIADLAITMLEHRAEGLVSLEDFAVFFQADATPDQGCKRMVRPVPPSESQAPRPLVANAIGENLLSLLRELLEVDRHRKKIAPNEKLRDAAVQDGIALQNGEFLGVRELARRVGVSPRAIVDWRRSAIYHKEISMGLWISPGAVALIFASKSKKYS